MSAPIHARLTLTSYEGTDRATNYFIGITILANPSKLVNTCLNNIWFVSVQKYSCLFDIVIWERIRIGTFHVSDIIW